MSLLDKDNIDARVQKKKQKHHQTYKTWFNASCVKIGVKTLGEKR